MRSAPNFPRHFSQSPFKALSTSLHKLFLKWKFFSISRKDISKHIAYANSGIVWVAFIPVQGMKSRAFMHSCFLTVFSIKTMLTFQMCSEVTIVPAIRFGFLPLPRYKQQLQKILRHRQKIMFAISQLTPIFIRIYS